MPDLPQKDIRRALNVVGEFFKRDWNDAWCDELARDLIEPLGLAHLIGANVEEFRAQARGNILAEWPGWRNKELWKSGTGPWVRNPMKVIEIVEKTALRFEQ